MLGFVPTTPTVGVTPTTGVPYWVPLVVGITVGMLGLIGVAYTQWRSDRREADARHETRERERAQWDRQERQQHEQWAREDAARTYEQRRDAYLRYSTEFDQVWELVAGRYYLPGHWPEAVPEGDETYVKLYEELRTLKLFASQRVADLAEEAMRTLQKFDRLPPHEGENYEQAEQLNQLLRTVYDRLRDLMRADLGVPAESPFPRPAEAQAPEI